MCEICVTRVLSPSYSLPLFLIELMYSIPILYICTGNMLTLLWVDYVKKFQCRGDIYCSNHICLSMLTFSLDYTIHLCIIQVLLKRYMVILPTMFL